MKTKLVEKLYEMQDKSGQAVDYETAVETILTLIRAEMPGEKEYKGDTDILDARRVGFNNYRQTFLKILGE